MIGLILIALAQTTVAQPTPREQEVVVTARRLKDWRGRAAASARGISCRTTQSTGDADLDLIACDSLRYCMGLLTPAAAAAKDKKLSRADRDARLRNLNVRLAACGEEQQTMRVADLVERRAAARTGNASN